MGARQIHYIVVHHPADDNIDKTLRDHIRSPFTDAPYDFWLEYPSGDLVKGRSLAKKGAHIVPDYVWAKHVNNSSAIGVAFEGNFDDEKPPFEPSGRQIERGAALIGQLCAEWNIHPYDSQEALKAGQGVVPHCVVSQTACPGRHFLVHWKRLIGKARYYYNTEKEVNHGPSKVRSTPR